MITIVFAPPRTGKTCFLAHMARETAFDFERNTLMRKAIQDRYDNGFSHMQTVPFHCVSSNFDMTFRKFGYSPRYSRRINPFRLGYANPHVRTHFNFPYESIFITEAQKYLNSRMSRNYPDWQSRWYEQHGHNDLDVWLDTQRPMLIDVNIRELSRFIEIVRLSIKTDGYGKPSGLRWLVRLLPDSSAFEHYMTSGKQDKGCFEELEVTADYNVFRCYDSQNCKPKFYAGHMDEDLDYVSGTGFGDDVNEYLRYLATVDDELPEGFYQTTKKKEAL